MDAGVCANAGHAKLTANSAAKKFFDLRSMVSTFFAGTSFWSRRSVNQLNASRLLHEFDLARSPLFCEKRFKRAVKAEHDVEALVRRCLNPIAVFHVSGLGRAEIHG